MAKAASQTQFEQVTALYEERQRFEAWLAALEAKRATTPVHIYTRVHADYGARLQRVVEELRTHRTALQELESTLIDRLTALDSEEAKHRDEAAEAELRATVGELASEHFDGSHRAHERRDRESERGAWTRAGGAVAAAPSARCRNGAAAGCGCGPGAVRAEHSAHQRCRACDSSTRALPRRPRAPNAPPPPTPADWELSFENALGGNPAPASARPSGPRPAEKAPERAQEPNPFDDLEFLKTMVDRNSDEQAVVNPTRERGAERSAGCAESGSPGDDADVAAGEAASVEAVAGGRERIAAHHARRAVPRRVPSLASRRVGAGWGRDSVPSYLKESPPEQVKTLKCQECGTLNYPTEWYCERCGAELAAL